MLCGPAYSQISEPLCLWNDRFLRLVGTRVLCRFLNVPVRLANCSLWGDAGLPPVCKMERRGIPARTHSCLWERPSGLKNPTALTLRPFPEMCANSHVLFGFLDLASRPLRQGSVRVSRCHCPPAHSGAIARSCFVYLGGMLSVAVSQSWGGERLPA